MKALAWTSVGNVQLVERPKPTLQLPTDAIIRASHASIRGTDIHVRDGLHLESGIGLILSHEGVSNRVIVMCITACSACDYSRRSMPGHCTSGGWQMGHTLDGLQSEAMILMSDVFSSGFECGVLRGKVVQGCTVVIIGVGLVSSLPSTKDVNRLNIAKGLGADFTLNPEDGDVGAAVRAITKGKGCNTVIEAVSFVSTMDIAQEMLAVGGVLANIGVHSTKVDFHLQKS
ncbi:chaperonin 10-like protein [Cadophora sp. MPI-SDFR-AT-0126]|nr:chaperonin 10-like protein [Leotiomycetes sp. MPI-SDFR-AT-0126]